MMTSDFRLEVETQPFCTCVMKNMQYNPYLWPNCRIFHILKEIWVKEHDGDIRFSTGSGNMAISCMRNASGHNYRNSSFIVDVAMGQIPRSTERISSLFCFQGNSTFESFIFIVWVCRKMISCAVCRNTLGSRRVIDLVNTHMLFWACSVNKPEGYRGNSAIWFVSLCSVTANAIMISLWKLLFCVCSDVHNILKKFLMLCYLSYCLHFNDREVIDLFKLDGLWRQAADHCAFAGTLHILVCRDAAMQQFTEYRRKQFKQRWRLLILCKITK